MISNEHVPFKCLLGKTLVGVDLKRAGGAFDDVRSVIFTTVDGEVYLMKHEQDCCEHVRMQDICGDIADLLHTPILLAEEVSNAEAPLDYNYEEDAHLWTFYKLSTIKGSVTMRWLGESNGYYGMDVELFRTTTEPMR